MGLFDSKPVKTSFGRSVNIQDEDGSMNSPGHSSRSSFSEDEIQKPPVKIQEPKHSLLDIFGAKLDKRHSLKAFKKAKSIHELGNAWNESMKSAEHLSPEEHKELLAAFEDKKDELSEEEESLQMSDGPDREDFLRDKLPVHLKEASLEQLRTAMSIIPPDILEKLEALEEQKNSPPTQAFTEKKFSDQLKEKAVLLLNKEELELINNSKTLEELSTAYKDLNENTLTLEASKDLIREAYFKKRQMLTGQLSEEAKRI